MKYVGSKAKIAKDIVPILQTLINLNGIKTYIEPFVGGQM
jgi:DNA adenine methylase